MLNKLPEKLTFLRKHYGLSQGDIAEKLNVRFTDYMNWENGNSIPSISNIRKLSVMFGVPVETFVDNRKTIVLPKTEAIAHNTATPVRTEGKMSQTVQGSTTKTQQIGSVQEDLGGTRVMDAKQIQFAAKKSTDHSEKKGDEQQKRKRNSYFIIAMVSVLVAVIGLTILYFGTKKKENFSVSPSNINRIAAGDTFTLFLDKKNDLLIYGDFDQEDLFQEVVQVSAYGSHAVGLKADGTVVTNDRNEEVSKWSGIVAVAAGKSHTVGLTKDGTVLCAGNALACQVSDWTGVQSIYAGDDVTFAIADGKIKVSGNANDFSAVNNAVSISVGDAQVLITNQNGTVTALSLKGDAAADVSSWKNIVTTAVGKNYVVGLNDDGMVSIVTEDAEMKEYVESWKDIKYIAAYDDTLVAFDRSGKMYGYGDNANGQYESSFKPEAKQLAQVKNIEFTVTTANVNVKWDPVENADYYELTVNTNPLLEHKNIISNSDSIPSSQLKDGETYVVAITAHSNKQDKYKKSEITSINFTYSAKTVPLKSPDHITGQGLQNAWYFAWAPVENADTYNLLIDGTMAAEGIHTTTVTIDGISFAEGTAHEISIVAFSSNPAYTESAPAKVTLTYKINKGKVKVKFIDESDKEVGSKTYEMPVGTYNAINFINPKDLPKDYMIIDEEVIVNVIDGKTAEISIQVEK